METTALWQHADSETQSGRSLATLVRQSGRFIAVIAYALVALAEAAVSLPLEPRRQRRAKRARWLHRWCTVATRVTGLRIATHGAAPRSGLLVSNHLSYLDIIALSALQPCVFVAKREVKHWPIFGWLACAAGTVFVDRTRRRDSLRAVDQIRRALGDKVLVVLFPEGTSSDGATVLPFKSALLAPAVRLDLPVTVAAVHYSLQRGSVADEICYWRDMNFLPHLWNLCGKSVVDAHLSFQSVTCRSQDRKALARELHSAVKSLHSSLAELLGSARKDSDQSREAPAVQR
jgi:1-acyl-sn-glycerol-3-phosphate acyltransferase